ncbi:MAG: FAD-dependent oxidoreductase [Calditrichaeota bacterium]|nr:FAD-dependent oxidoreductase [Calditrichota bacterium]RQW02966.1 MAG: FAD-dependent oxidoreductase [Calditrichota bacterium]
MKKKLQDCLIIGSGICGLMAAHRLTKQGMVVTILDKGRGAGGRIATRRLATSGGIEAVADYGAQFVTVSDRKLKPFMDEWRKSGILKLWYQDEKKNDRYIGIHGLRDITRHLARNLTVHQQKKVIQISHEGNWIVKNTDDSCFQADVLILTPPLPQSLELLRLGNIPLEKSLLSELQKIRYTKCIAIMGIPKKPGLIPSPGGLQLREGPVQWIADNQKKGISPHCPSITIHAEHQFSEEYYEKPDEEIVSVLGNAVKDWISGEWETVKIHRWKYSRPVTFFPELSLLLRNPGPLVLAGDAFSNARVESAALSGLDAADKLLQH